MYITDLIFIFQPTYHHHHRLISHGSMELNDKLELLSRMTLHIDVDLRELAFSSLQQYLLDLADKREDIVAIFISFILTKVNRAAAAPLEGAVQAKVVGIKAALVEAVFLFECFDVLRCCVCGR